MWKAALLSLVLVAAVATEAAADAADEAYARKRCIAQGFKPDTPELAECVRTTVFWLERSRRDAQRSFN